MGLSGTKQIAKMRGKMEVQTQMGTFLSFLRTVNGNVSAACELLKISRAQYLEWLNTDQDFRFQVMIMIESIGDKVEAKLLEKIDSGDIAAIIFYCKTKLKHRGYVESAKEQTAGSGKTKINVSVMVPPKPSNIETIQPDENT